MFEKYNKKKFYNICTCAYENLLDGKLGFISHVRHQNEIYKKNISSAISAQQISGTNSESK